MQHPYRSFRLRVVREQVMKRVFIILMLITFSPNILYHVRIISDKKTFSFFILSTLLSPVSCLLTPSSFIYNCSTGHDINYYVDSPTPQYQIRIRA